MFLDIVDLDENPDNSLVLAKLSDDVVKSVGKKGGGFGGKSYQGQFLIGGHHHFIIFRFPWDRSHVHIL